MLTHALLSLHALLAVAWVKWPTDEPHYRKWLISISHPCVKSGQSNCHSIITLVSYRTPRVNRPALGEKRASLAIMGQVCFPKQYIMTCTQQTWQPSTEAAFLDSDAFRLAAKRCVTPAKRGFVSPRGFDTWVWGNQSDNKKVVMQTPWRRTHESLPQVWNGVTRHR